VLVATDIAARGIDVAEIGHVINYDLPDVPEDYVHRVGRTARASASGKASAFCSPDERPLLKDIEKLTRMSIPVINIPRDSPAFVDALSRRVDKPAGTGSGRHARTHPKRAPGGAFEKKRTSKPGGGGGGGGGGGAKRFTGGTWKPKRR